MRAPLLLLLDVELPRVASPSGIRASATSVGVASLTPAASDRPSLDVVDSGSAPSPAPGMAPSGWFAGWAWATPGGCRGASLLWSGICELAPVSGAVSSPLRLSVSMASCCSAGSCSS